MIFLKMNKILLLSFFLISINACSNFSEVGKVMRNEKVNNTDEFLVKKRQPLTRPPEVNKIPEPGSIKSSKSSKNNNSIKEIFKIPEDNNIKKNKFSSIEQKIIGEIKK